jgi:hypothetical protein
MQEEGRGRCTTSLGAQSLQRIRWTALGQLHGSIDATRETETHRANVGMLCNCTPARALTTTRKKRHLVACQRFHRPTVLARRIFVVNYDVALTVAGERYGAAMMPRRSVSFLLLSRFFTSFLLYFCHLAGSRRTIRDSSGEIERHMADAHYTFA